MTFADLSSLGSFVSGIAVLISLAYLTIQIRQNTRHQRAALQQGRTGRNVDLLMETASEEAAGMLLRGRAGDRDMNPTEIERFIRVATAVFVNFEEGYVLGQYDMLDRTTTEADDASMQNAILPWPGYRAAWEMLRPSMHAGFRDHVDGLLRATPAVTSPDRGAQWKELVFAQTSKR